MNGGIATDNSSSLCQVLYSSGMFVPVDGYRYHLCSPFGVKSDAHVLLAASLSLVVKYHDVANVDE